ncbi:hypothetical protein GJ629_05160 [Halapricum sp. CBA1109]|uniref:hypothetical protein n=1 Tax=Halapricum sp. CBA1109 TaxID=2668068 RepID=UPI0012F72623|nr:hypothetical protein [Halapricum sp. CBA1109]MUV89367.1 hypothetical protein [Halapricum sp. CBA1109]
MEYGLVALWLVTYLALLYVSMPIARALVPSLADRGAGIALPLGLALVWTVAYFVGRFSITAGLWLGIAVLAVAAGVLWYRGATVDNRQFAETAAVFSLAFLFMIAIRATTRPPTPGPARSSSIWGCSSRCCAGAPSRPRTRGSRARQSSTTTAGISSPRF